MPSAPKARAGRVRRCRGAGWRGVIALPYVTTVAVRPTRVSDDILPVILAGGAGTRLWPLSRELHPKQFLRLVGEMTMLQHTLARLAGLRARPPVLVCHQDHRFVLAEQCRQVGVAPGAILLEPASRNTAPALALAAFRALGQGDPVLLALPADTHIAAAAPLHAAVAKALPLATGGRIVVFGTTPRGPATGYGYIRAGAPVRGVNGAAEVAAFVEKPSQEVAARYAAARRMYWNCGMFLLRASVYLEELRAFQPAIHAACAEAVANEREDLDFLRPGDAFKDSPADSIDYAVMEHTRRACVLPADLEWADLGSWNAVAEAQPRDAHANTVDGDVIAVSTTGSHLAAGSRLVAAVGLRNMVVVETEDAVLVAAKDRVQDVRQVVERLRRQARSEHRANTTSYRPWGRAETFKKGNGFLVKRISVAPGHALSLQVHQHRAEHWVVVRGEAEVRRGEQTFTLTANQSTFIPAGERHRLANHTAEPLEVIEVQVGEHLSEDDIVRFEDRYGRTR